MAQMSEQSTRDAVIRVCAYIRGHLDEDLTLQQLSAIANFSKHHFHRQFAAFTGVTVHQFVQLSRLKRASYRLVFHPEMSVLEIALEAGFEYPESFARAFKRKFEKTPTKFREAPDWDDWHQNYTFEVKGEKMNYSVEVVEFPETLVAVFEHQGSPESLNDSVGRFIEWRKSTGLSPRDRKATYGVSYGDPRECEPGEYRFDVCGEVDEPVPGNPQGVITKTIPGGRCARVTYLGSRDNMEEPIYDIYRRWIPENGEKVRDYPCFFQYRNFFPEVPESELVTDIFVPLER